MREEYDALQEQVNKAQEIIIAYEGQLNILNAIEEETSEISSDLVLEKYGIKTSEQLQVLTDGANEATSAIADTASKVMALAESLEESGIASMEQVEQLKSLFPDTYRQALIIENDQIKINTQAMKDLMVARAEELVSKAQEAVDSIKADNAVAESALQRANFIISATRAEIRANASMSESDRERAQNTINAAKSEIAAINEAAKARGVSLTNAETTSLQAYLAQIKNTSIIMPIYLKRDKAASSTNSLSEAQKL